MTYRKPSDRMIRVLVVEDEPLLAIDLERQLTACGLSVVGPAPSVAKALKLIDEVGCDVAILDVNLRDETAEPVAAELRQRGMPFVFLSGISREQFPDWFYDAQILSKPANFAQLLPALRSAVKSV